jgi:hypothetical protein
MEAKLAAPAEKEKVKMEIPQPRHRPPMLEKEGRLASPVVK